MEQQEAIQGLENAMRTEYHYVDGKMAAYLNFIGTTDQGMHPALFGHIVQQEGLLETNGNRNDDTYCGQNKWQKVCMSMKSKWEELRDKVLNAEVPMTPEQVGELIIEMLGTEKKDLNKYALLSWVLKYGEPSFIPYVEVKGLPLQVRDFSRAEYFEARDELQPVVDRIKAIRKSPMMKNPFMEAAAIQEVLNGIEDPAKRAMVSAIAEGYSTGTVETSIHVIGMPGMGGLSSMLGGGRTGLMEALMESRGGPGFGGSLIEALMEDDDNPMDRISSMMQEKCAECDKRHDCELPPAEKWRAENE